MPRYMGCEELLELLDDDELLVVDCRHDADWERCPRHIPGALRMSVVEMFRLAHILPDDELIVLVGTSTTTVDCEQGCRLLARRGRDAICLEGGLQAWLERGLPTEWHGAFETGNCPAP